MLHIEASCEIEEVTTKMSVRIDSSNDIHTRITVFQDGGNAGQLCMNTKEAHLFIDALESYGGFICEVYKHETTTGS